MDGHLPPPLSLSGAHFCLIEGGANADFVGTLSLYDTVKITIVGRQKFCCCFLGRGKSALIVGYWPMSDQGIAWVAASGCLVKCLYIHLNVDSRFMPKLNPFRPATTQSKLVNLLKTGLQTAGFWLVFLLVLPTLIGWLETRLGWPGFVPLPMIGWGGFVLFSLLGLYGGYTMSTVGRGTPLPMDCPNELVISGPYRVVRNPLAVAGIGQGVCVGLVMGSFAVVSYALCGAVLWHLFIRPAEERDLAARFGEAYADYRRAVWCWWPRW